VKPFGAAATAHTAAATALTAVAKGHTAALAHLFWEQVVDRRGPFVVGGKARQKSSTVTQARAAAGRCTVRCAGDRPAPQLRRRERRASFTEVQLMGAYPTSPRADVLAWCQSHTAAWTANAAAIGLSPAQASAFSTATTALATAVANQNLARQASEVATQAAVDAYAALKSVLGDNVRLIRAFAEVQVKPSVVYGLAEIPPPAAPTPMPPPGQPTDLLVTLTPASGNLLLRWKCGNPPGASGTSYVVRRRLPGESGFSFLGISGKKEFSDTTVTAGPDWVQYTVQGQRSDSTGPLSEVFIVNFGQMAGMMTASVSTESPRMESGPSASTVNGREVRKVLPGMNAGNASGNPAGRA